MIKVAICDDDMTICDLIEGILEYSSNYVDVFYNGEDFMRNLASGNRYDIIFLDIELNSINGVEIGHIIRSEFHDLITQIIYISSKENYAMQLFKIRPADFLVKPFGKDEIENAYKNCCDLLADSTIKFKNGYDVRFIKIKEIRYICSEARKLRVVTVHSEECFYGKMDDFIMEFESANLIRIHKSYVINPMHLSRYTYDFALMNDGNELNISKSYKTKVRQKLMNLWRQRNDNFIHC